MSEDFMDLSNASRVIVSEMPTKLERRDTAALLTMLLLLTEVYEKGIQWKWLASKSTANLFSAKKLWTLLNSLEGMRLINLTEEFLRYFYYTKSFE